RRGPAAAGPARAVPVGLPEPPVEPHAGPLAGAALPSRATDLGRVALRRPADAPRTRYGPPRGAGGLAVALAVGTAQARLRRPAGAVGARRPGRRGPHARADEGQGDARALFLQGRAGGPVRAGGTPGRDGGRRTPQRTAKVVVVV